MDSPGVYSDSLLEQDDLVYHCKGCAEILEEGKAFELAGNRWHINCFRCHTCGLLLDSDANLLLLGDGSLICNNCTYSCSACGNKIEDLAILTGDQAFCAHCFRCRNCKRKIENLRYARTSQGIFCMNCHESVMARRRKRAKGSSRTAQNPTNTGPVEKALPSLPPGVSGGAFVPAADTPSPSDPLSESTNTRALPERHNSQLRGTKEHRTKPSVTDASRKDETTLPASTYGLSRPSNVSDETEDGEERGFLPMAFDPTPVAPPNTVPRKQVPNHSDTSSPPTAENKPPRDYLNKSSTRSNRDHVKDLLRDGPVESRGASIDQDRDPDRRYSQIRSSPHVASQDAGRGKRRDASEGSTPTTTNSIIGSSVDVRPADQPKSSTEAESLVHELAADRVTSQVSRSDSKAGTQTSPAPVELPASKTPNIRSTASPKSVDSPDTSVNPFEDPKPRDYTTTTPIPPHSRPVDAALREESRPTPSTNARLPDPEPATTIANKTAGAERRPSTSSVRSSLVDAVLSAGRKSLDTPPPRAPGRVMPISRSATVNDFVTPRPSPAPPVLTTSTHQKHDSISTLQSSDGQRSPAHRSVGSLPQQTLDGPFSMEEEMARILRGENKQDSQTTDSPNGANVLRRVSNVVKHGRSFSDRGINSSGRTHTSPDTASIEISAPILTPTTPGPGTPNNADQLRAQLKRANHRITELEAEKSGLQDKVDSSAEITAASNELREKRNTMVVLDTQREMIVAELESMTAQLKRVKDSGQPLDLQALKTDISRDLANALQKVKDNMSRQIEDLMHKRNELTEEIGTLIQMKDKGFQEYESLSSKNAQLLEMNSQMVQNIQGIYKANASGKSNGVAGAGNLSASGLGILHSGSRTDSNAGLTEETEAEPATILTGPQVVNIRKAQPKKFNWRKGGEKMAKNVTKGIKGAFAGDKAPTTSYGDIGLPYNFTQVATGGDQNNVNGRAATDSKAPGGGFGFFGQKNAAQKSQPMTSLTKNASNSNLLAAAEASVLFGSELDARCDYEKRVVPSIVSRCIEEVESRGMAVEGIYRKSGGSGMVKTVQQGFEKDGKYDISDPDLDIHAITSALKQYFRKLPTPLITYDAYETLLEAAQIQDKEKQILGLQAAVNELPDSHRSCLEYLVQHLTRVISHESHNLMTPLNISVVFAPTIMRPQSIEREMSDMQLQRAAVQALLEHQRAVFGSGD